MQSRIREGNNKFKQQLVTERYLKLVFCYENNVKNEFSVSDISLNPFIVG